MVLTMTFSVICVLNHAIKISLNVVGFLQKQIITSSKMSLLSRFLLCFEGRQLFSYTISSFNVIYKHWRIWLNQLDTDSISRERANNCPLTPKKKMSILRGENSLILTLPHSNSYLHISYYPVIMSSKYCSLQSLAEKTLDPWESYLCWHFYNNLS